DKPAAAKAETAPRESAKKPAKAEAAPREAEEKQAPAKKTEKADGAKAEEAPPQAGGTIEFKLPELGEGVTSADVASLLVEEGAQIEAGQNVLELETDKAVVELPCPHAGRVAKIHVKPGDSLKV